MNSENIVFHWDTIASKKRSEIKSDTMVIRSPSDLFLFFLRVIFLRNYQIPEDNTSFPHVDLFDDSDDWWGWMGFAYDEFKDEWFDSINIPQQVKNIINTSSIIKNPWKGQQDIVIGCGHTFGLCRQGHHAGQYTVDSDPQMGSDCISSFGNFSLAKAIPEAKGKIKAIILEGILIRETPCFVNDLMELLENGGRVYRDSGHIVIEKIAGLLYVYKHGVRKPYEPWRLKLDDCDVSVLDLGSDALGWTSQIAKVKDENESGVWDHLPKNPKTPFDPDFGINDI